MNRSAAHTALVNAILAELGALPGVIMGINSSGQAREYNADGEVVRRISYGWPTSDGGTDILVAVAPLGRLVALEAKTGDAKAKPNQRAVHNALRAVGVVVAVVRSVDEARRAIEEARM